MDSTRFDHIARLAANVSRRDIVRALLVSAIAAPMVPARTVLAQEGIVVVGGACASSTDCRQVDMQRGAICADNGFDADGALNCCLDEGCCASDADCCGDRRCAPTGDVCSVCAQPPFATRFSGQLCTSDADCVGSVVCEVGCIQTRCNCVEDGAWTAPAARPMPSAIPETDAALIVAEDLSRLEVAGQFAALYDRMHPDARRIIPPEVVVGWYEQDFVPPGPASATAAKVRIIPWVWDVTGETYPETAEVAWRQTGAGGDVVRGEVRLVKDEHGNWSWFFGRDRAFVDEQIARFTGQNG